MKLSCSRTHNSTCLVFGTDPSPTPDDRLYLQNKSLSMEGNFQSVDGVADVLKKDAPRLASPFKDQQTCIHQQERLKSLTLLQTG